MCPMDLMPQGKEIRAKGGLRPVDHHPLPLSLIEILGTTACVLNLEAYACAG